MNPAITLAVIAGCGWATNIVLVGWALRRTGAPAIAGALAGLSVAAIATLTLAVATGADLPQSGDIWRFALVGAIAPGSSQGLFVASIGAIGTSRSSVLVSTNPLISVLLAIAFLDEELRLIIIVGTVLTVLGGVLISWEPGIGFRQLGTLLALATAVTFGVRDVVARQFTSSSDISIMWASAIVLTSGALVVLGIAAVTQGLRLGAGVRRSLPEFAGSGIAIAIALTSLFAAFDRAQVSLVAPLSNAAQSLAVVALGSIVFGARERTVRILAALVLVVVGGALITAS